MKFAIALAFLVSAQAPAYAKNLYCAGDDEAGYRIQIVVRANTIQYYQMTHTTGASAPYETYTLSQNKSNPHRIDVEGYTPGVTTGVSGRIAIRGPITSITARPTYLVLAEIQPGSSVVMPLPLQILKLTCSYL